MNDTISRAMALEVIEAMMNLAGCQDGKVLCGKLYAQIKDLPATDAIPVVRCKDCRWVERAKNCHGEDVVICNNTWSPISETCELVKLDWFCADGERREADGIRDR